MRRPARAAPREPPCCTIICGTLGRTRRAINTHLFDLEVVGPQRLLDFLLHTARCRLHGAAEPVEYPLESELLHRESVRARILCPRAAVAGPGYITAVRRGPLAGFGGRRVGRSRAPFVATAQGCRRRSLPPRAAADADTRSRRRSTKTRRGTASGMYGNAVSLTDR